MDKYLNNNFKKENLENILTKEEVLQTISRFVENPIFVRELSDEQGLYLLEVKVEGSKENEMIEYRYVRKGKFPNKNEALKTNIYVTYYKDGIPISGSNIADYNENTKKWEEIK